MAVYTDDFNRGDSADLGSPWVERETNAAAIQVNNNRLVTVGTAWGAVFYDNAFTADHYSKIVWKARTNNPVTGPAVRVSGAASTALTFYAAVYNRFDGRVELRKYVAENVTGAGTTLGTFTVTLVDTDVVYIEAVGTTIRVLINDVERISVTDSDIASGQGGFVNVDNGFGGTNDWDDWEAGDIVPPRRGLVSWVELEVPDFVRRGLVSYIEFEVPSVSGGGGGFFWFWHYRQMRRRRKRQ